MRGGKHLRATSAQFDSGSDDDSNSDEEPETQNGGDGGGSDDENDEDAGGGGGGGDDEDDDEDEEDDNDDDRPNRKRGADGSGGKKKKKKKSSSLNFFDEEAEDAGSEDEDEPYGTHYDPHDVVKKHYTEEDIMRENLDDDTRDLIRRQDERRAQLSAQFTADVDDDETSVADIARGIENRHRMQNRTVDRRFLDAAPDSGRMGPGGEADLSAVSQQSLVPSIKDPSLWMFSCTTGKEQDVVYQLMNKAVAFARQNKPLGITGVVAAQSKGRIYIESYSEPAVIEAVQGIRTLMQYSMRLVPISDMTTVMTVIPSKKPVKKNEWVRLTRGHFKGDLALVRAVRESGLKCVVQCVPRIDLTLFDLPPAEARVRRRTVRPPQKFFNSAEITALDRVSSVGRQNFRPLGNIMCDYFEGSYYHDGYLLKEVTVGTMIKSCGDDDPPTLDELQRFRTRKKNSNSNYDDEDNDDGEENVGSKMAASLLEELSELQGKTGLGKTSEGGSGLVIGDTVEVVEGDLVGMRGKLLSIDGTTVKVKPSNASDLGDMTEVEFLASQVRKHIPVGAHVKVIDGRYANETGLVVAVDQLDGDTDATAVVLTDVTHKEVSVRISQLQESAEIAMTHDKLAGYELHDLVVLSGGGSANEVGVIVRVGREEFSVINNHGNIREVRPEELRGKRNGSSNRAVALDVQGNQIRVGNTVQVAEGLHKGKQATIKRMSRAQLFLYSQTRTENAGIFVVRSRSCVLAGSGANNRNNAGDGGVSPFSTPQSQHGGGGPGGGKGRRDDSLVGKTVRIQTGQWKGYQGIVCDTTATHVQVELHSRLKKVMVVRERVAVIGDKYGATEDQDRQNNSANSMMAPSTPFLSGGATPMHGGATPMHGGATPMHGGATPMHGGATPMHDGMGGGFTPSHSNGTDDVWRPGGSIDREPLGDSSANNDADAASAVSGWGTSNGSDEQSNDPFASSSSTGADTGGGWGSSSNDQGGSTWTPGGNDTSQSSFENPSSGTDEGGLGSSLGHDTYTPGDSSSSVGGGGTDRNNGGMDASAVGGGGDASAAVWFMERVCVLLKQNNNAEAVIKEINGDGTALVELEDKSTMTVRGGEVSMVPPKEHDMVLVTGGADVGVEGELVCIDGTDAILKDSNEDFKIVDFVNLAKIETEA